MSTPLRELILSLLGEPSAKEAFADDPAAFLTDHGWSDLDGLDVCTALRALIDEMPIEHAVRLHAVVDGIDSFGRGLDGAIAGLATTSVAFGELAAEDADPLADPALALDADPAGADTPPGADVDDTGVDDTALDDTALDDDPADGIDGEPADRIGGATAPEGTPDVHDGDAGIDDVPWTAGVPDAAPAPGDTGGGTVQGMHAEDRSNGLDDGTGLETGSDLDADGDDTTAPTTAVAAITDPLTDLDAADEPSRWTPEDAVDDPVADAAEPDFDDL